MARSSSSTCRPRPQFDHPPAARDLRGRTLLVVREEPGDVSPLRLSPDELRARASTPFGGDRLGFATTAASRGDRLLAVDWQLDRAPDGARPPLTFAVLRLPAGLL